MKDKFVVAPKNEFILDVVHSALKRVEHDVHHIEFSMRRGVVLVRTPLDPSTWDGSISSRGSAYHATACIGSCPYLVSLPVVDLRLFRRVTDPLENGRLASVRSPDDKDPETAKLLPEVFEVIRVAC